jgi:hypothetical protein
VLLVNVLPNPIEAKVNNLPEVVVVVKVVLPEPAITGFWFVTF